MRTKFRPSRWMTIGAALMTLSGMIGRVADAQSDNPPLPGFNLDGSDPQAIEIADQVMEALGGRKAWDDTRYVRWRFFGKRLHVWDKHTGRHRYESGDLVVLWNLDSREGRAWKAGEEISNPQALEEALKEAYSAWVNDSYWMFMPYKLKDSGVTLKYVGETAMEEGGKALVLELTFEDVGETPQNRYHVYVDPESHLVVKWDYYENASDEEPSMSTPWKNWEQHGEILLSDDRGRGKHTDIAVFDRLPDSVFDDPSPVDWSRLEART